MDIFELSDRAVDEASALDPLGATYSGVSGYDHLWPDLSPEGNAAQRAFYDSLKSQALECPTPDDRHLLAQQVLIEDCNAYIRHFENHGPHYELNNLASPHQTLRFVFGSMADQTVEHWDAIITRLETIHKPLAGYRATLAEGLEVGNVVSRRQVEIVTEQGASAAGENSSFHSLASRLDASPANTPELAERLDAAITHAKASFAEFNSFLATYLPSAPEADGVGEERYLNSAERFLGTRLDAKATYRWGWNEVERLRAEMAEACKEIDPDASMEEVIDRLNTSPDFAAADIDEFIEVMKDRQTQALANLEGVHFDVPEQIRAIDVQVEPAGGALAAHYVGPSEDFSRPGSVWYPVEGKEHFPLFNEITTAYHEGFPGHHLQVGVQAALRDDLSRYHRSMVWYPGSGEGWALYAEQVMGELGYLERPEYRIGLIASQLFRSARIAVDIGMHLGLPIPDDVSFHPGEEWTFDLAFELMSSCGALDSDQIHSEIIRYLGWPGQAISYKVGEKAILDLREEWKAAGDFDPKLFHSTVLGVGSVGLDLLEQRVRAAIPVG